MSHPWDPEIDVSTALAAGLIRRQFPQLSGEIRLLGVGWDNDVFAVGDALAFRFPRRTQALAQQERELLVLPHVAELGLPVPMPRYRGVPDDTYPWPFWGGPAVPGSELCRVHVDRVRLGTELGQWLRVLHDQPAPQGLPVDPMRRADSAHRAALARPALSSLAGLGLISGPPYPLLQGQLPGPTGEQVLLHGDLHLRHVLVHPDGAAAGVIDWGDSCVGDPAIDLSFAFGALAGSARTAFFRAYGDIDADREVTARVLAVQLCTALAENAHDIGDAQLLGEALAGIARAQN